MMRTGIVQTQHQDTRFSVTEYTEQLRKPDAHDFWTTRALGRRIQVGDAQMSREKRLCVDRAPGATPPDCCKQHSPSCLSSTETVYPNDNHRRLKSGAVTISGETELCRDGWLGPVMVMRKTAS